MCGLVGIVGTQSVSQTLYDALILLQHRGQDSAGISTFFDDQFFLQKGNGLVQEVFDQKSMENLPGPIGIGHVRYPTAGTQSSQESQPLYVNTPYGMTLAHNGNLTNTESLKAIVSQYGRHINTRSDSEVLLNIFANELNYPSEIPYELSPEKIFSAIKRLLKQARGGYAVVSLINGIGLVAFRDPFGIRPLCYGVKKTPEGKEVMIASESATLSALGFSEVKDIKPGEAIIVTESSDIFTQQALPAITYKPCLFEYIYFARPDSVIDEISVYQFRVDMGKTLAYKVSNKIDINKIDAVIPIPDTSRTSALSLAQTLRLEYREGFVKNRYIGRTFIMPGQTQRKRSVKRKLNVIEEEFKNKNVLLVDDSIVRGTTCSEIIQMARDAGANEVYFASAAPPVRFPNVYGIDMPSQKELFANQYDRDKLAAAIGCDELIYQTLEDLIKIGQSLNKKLSGFESSIFDGQYITDDVTSSFLAMIAQDRSNTVLENQLLS